MQSIAKSVEPLPYELVNLQHSFHLAYASTQRASTLIDAFEPQTPEGEALRDIYHDILALCLEAMREATSAHLPEELAALLAFEHAELDYMAQRRRGQRKAAPVAAAAD